jgi:hypothetical protein
LTYHKKALTGIPAVKISLPSFFFSNFKVIEKLALNIRSVRK